MRKKYLIDIKNQKLWAFIVVDKEDIIIDMNQRASEYFKGLGKGQSLVEALKWFKKEWLYDSVTERVIKTSTVGKLFIEFISKEENEKVILIKDIRDYKDALHLWCEISETVIGLQPFIESFQDAILVINGEGVIRACNNYFMAISGLKDEKIINESIYKLEEKKMIPYCAIMDTFKTKKTENSVVKFKNGKKVFISASPLFGNDGEILRVMATIEDISKHNELYNDLPKKDLRKNYSEKKKNISEAFEKMNLGVFRSSSMKNILNLLGDIAPYDFPLLITGESGVGKTALAKCICMIKKNSLQNFVHINCGAIPETLIESELFGYEKGAFTGADKSKAGLFEIAQNGVILLDEIGDMPLNLQAKLLNVIQEKKFYRIGGTKLIETNAHIITATNQDLNKLIEEGTFRKDLFFRLNVIPISIPSLRERQEDIPLLAEQILKEINIEYLTKKSIDEDAMKILCSYDWPGNIRELKSIIERVVILTKDDEINSTDLLNALTKNKTYDFSLRKYELSSYNDNNSEALFWQPGQTLKKSITRIESKIIEQAINTYGSVRNAAKHLGVDESTITRKRNRNNNTAN